MEEEQEHFTESYDEQLEQNPDRVTVTMKEKESFSDVLIIKDESEDPFLMDQIEDDFDEPVCDDDNKEKTPEEDLDFASEDESSDEDYSEEKKKIAAKTPISTATWTKEGLKCNNADCGLVHQNRYKHYRHRLYKHKEMPPEEFRGSLHYCTENNCQAAFFDTDKRVVHLAKVHGITIPCPLGCGKTFCSLAGEKKHVEKLTCVENSIKKMAKIYNCNICNKEFKIRKSMIQHRLDCGKEGKSYECDHCDKKFNHERNLRKHKSTIHAI